MGKITLKGPVPKDHPMFSSGPEMVSRPGSSEFLKTSANAMAGETPASPRSSSDLQPETEADGK